MIEVARVAIALGGTALAAWQDARTSFIDDRITLAMISVGIFFNAFFADVSTWPLIAVVAAVIGALGWLAWRTGQLGGGDVLLFLGIHLLLPFNPRAPWLYPFIFSVLIAAGFFAAIASSAWFAKRLTEEKVFREKKTRWKTVVFVAVAGAGVAFIAFSSLNWVQKIFFQALLVPTLFFAFFKQEIMQRVVVKKTRLHDILDEDVLATQFFSPRLARIARKYALQKVLTKSELAKLRKIQRVEGISAWPVCKELPRFGPFVFAGLVASLLVGDLMLFVLISSL